MKGPLFYSKFIIKEVVGVLIGYVQILTVSLFNLDRLP